MSQTYTARSLDRNGRRVFTTGEHSTREAAVAEAFAARPNCTVSSSQGLGMNVQFHQPAPAAEPVREEAVAAARECGAVEIKGEPEYRYRIKSLGHSSARYGACEVCSQPVTEVFLQSEERRYSRGWTHEGCRSLFGHEACLLAQRRGGEPAGWGPTIDTSVEDKRERFHPNNREHFLLPPYEALTYDWQRLADLPGDENKGTRNNQYETLVHDGYAERHAAPITIAGRPAGTLVYYRKRLVLYPGACVVDLRELPEARQVRVAYEAEAKHHPPGARVYARLSLGGGTDFGPWYV